MIPARLHEYKEHTRIKLLIKYFLKACNCLQKSDTIIEIYIKSQEI